MGKSRRNRPNTGQRADPLSKPVKPPADPELAALREKSILPVLKDLQSSEPKSRTAAAGAISNIIQDVKCRKLLLREQVVHIVLHETLTDASLESRAAGWDILRVLTQEEEADFCVHLYRVDVLTAIEHAARKILESLAGPDSQIAKTSKAEQKFFWMVVVALTSIIGALAEAQDDILLAISKNQTILRFLFRTATSRAPTPEAVNGSLSCISILSEDNREFVEILLGDNSTDLFAALTTFRAEHDLRSVLACGVLHNIFSTMQWYDSSPGRDNSSDAVLIPTLSTTLKVASQYDDKDGKNSSSAEIFSLALEILASTGTSLLESFTKASKGGKAKKKRQHPVEGDKEGMDVDNEDGEAEESDQQAGDDDEDDEMDEAELEADMDMVTGADDYPDEAEGLDELPTLKALIGKAIPELIRLSKEQDKTDDLSLLIRDHALSALNNIAWTVSCLDFSEGQNAAILAAWQPAARKIWTQTVAPVLASDTSDVKLAASVTGLAWAIARTLRDRTPLQGGEHHKFISLYHASKNISPQPEDDPFQSLGVKCIGVLGQLALDPAPIELNREIGVFLLTIVTSLPDIPPADAVEALNQLFDMYGDENFACDAQVFWKEGFLKHFEDAVPKLRAANKKIDKRTATELRTRADEASLNLTRFVQYKQKHKP